MIYLFHGDNHSESRRALHAVPLIGEKRELDGLKIAPKDLESTLATTNLFSNETILIENLFSRLKSKDKDACIKLLTDYQGEKQILLWEKKELTKATLTKLPKSWIISAFKLPTQLFNFLDALSPGNAQSALSLFHQALATTPDLVIFTLLSRHVSNLLIASTATSPKLPPWQLGKLKSQAQKWTEGQLISFIDDLTKLDYQIKSGNTKLDYTSQLDLLLLRVLG